MQDRHIGDVRVTRIEEQMGPGFPAKDFFPSSTPTPSQPKAIGWRRATTSRRAAG